jgi:hypothetical protein
VIRSVEGPSLDDALKNAQRNQSAQQSGLSTSGTDGSNRAVTAKVDPTKAAGDPDWSRLKTDNAGVNSSGPAIRPASGGGPSDPFAKSGLSQADAQAGFEKVRSSVTSCRQRQVSRGLPTEAVKIGVILEIQPDGSVSDYKIEPASMQHTEFDICMQSHTGRWGFKSFDGKPVKIRRTYVLQ